MRNFIPERMVRATGRMMRMNIDDGDIFMGEFANGALCSIQTSFVTVGNYPGIEARIYGSKGALICRLVEEGGICERLWSATPDQVEFRELHGAGRASILRAAIAKSRGGRCSTPTSSASFITEILGEAPGNEGNFDDGAWVQETINAVEASLPGAAMGDAAARMTPSAALDRFFERYYRRRPVTATFTGVHDSRPSAAGLVAGRARGGGGGDAGRSARCSMRAGRVADDAGARVPGARWTSRWRTASSRSRSPSTRVRTSIAAIPPLWTGEAIFSVIGAGHARLRAACPSGCEAAAARLRAIPRFLDDARRTLTRVAGRPGATRPCASARLPRSCSGRACRRGLQMSRRPGAVTIRFCCKSCDRRATRFRALPGLAGAGSAPSPPTATRPRGATCSSCCCAVAIGARTPHRRSDDRGCARRSTRHTPASPHRLRDAGVGVLDRRPGAARRATAHRRRLPAALRAHLAALSRGRRSPHDLVTWPDRPDPLRADPGAHA